MGRRVQLRGGDSLKTSSFTGAPRELTVDTTKNTAVIHDGVKIGGYPLAKESVTDDHGLRLNRIEADDTVNGSISYKIKAAVESLKNGVDIDLDTLKELSDALNSAENDAATNLANSISTLRNELRNGADTNIDTFKEVEDELNSIIANIDDRYNKAEVDAITDLTKVNGHIIPLGNGSQDIGSTTNRFRSIYVNEAYLSTNTLYIGDTPVLGTDADTVVVKADPDQSILVKTTGTGSSGMQSQHEVQISTSGVNADIKLQATGTNSKVRLSGNGGIELSNDTTIQANLDVTGDVNFTGDVTVAGSSFIVDAETVKTKDNVIVLNDGEAGSGVTAGRAGIQIDRGAAAAFEIVFDEVTDKFLVGQVGGVYETLASREHVLSLITTETTARETADATINGRIDTLLDVIDCGSI